MENRLILAINPGSTSTKIAIYENTRSVFVKSILHDSNELKQFDKIADQFFFRKDIILKELEIANIPIENIKIVMGRGGLLKPIPSGIYAVNEKMKADLITGIQGQHASNLGGLIADDIARSLPNAKAYIVDPVVVDELINEARLTGLPQFKRRSIFHALNHKSIARIHAKTIGRNYEDLNLIITHMGGGISIGAHNKGKVIDVNQALDGEGPLTPERSGTLPVGDIINACYNGEYTKTQLQKMVTGEGGFIAYFGTNDARKIEKMAFTGDEQAILIQNTLGYQVAKYIGAMAAVLKGNVDYVLITGGLAHNKTIVEYITDRVKFIAPVLVYPGEDEMRALAFNASLILNNEADVMEYN